AARLAAPADADLRLDHPRTRAREGRSVHIIFSDEDATRYRHALGGDELLCVMFKQKHALRLVPVRVYLPLTSHLTLPGPHNYWDVRRSVWRRPLVAFRLTARSCACTLENFRLGHEQS